MAPLLAAPSPETKAGAKPGANRPAAASTYSGAVDTGSIRSYYRDGEFEKVTGSLNKALKSSALTRADSAFAFKYLGVAYAAEVAIREKSKYFFYQLLKTDRKADLLDLFVSESVNEIFPGALRMGIFNPMDDILARITARKAQRVAERKRALPPLEAERRARDLPPPAFNLLEILRRPAPHGLHVIAEVKKASPSKGVIREDFRPLDIAAAYARGGASALSVLTEEDFFGGSDEYLRAIAATVPLPALRKDFILEPYQVYEAKLLGASAFLLIAACLEAGPLENLIAVGRELGLTALVEVHDEAETEKSLRAGASLIGINNRNLRTFHTALEVTFRLRQRIPARIPVVSESGIATREDMLRLQAEGVQAVLVGESLMRERDEEAKLRALLGVEAARA